ATNLAPSPKAGIDLTNWGGVSLASGPTRVLPAGPPPGKGIDTAVQAGTDADGDYLYLNAIAVTALTPYRASVYVRLRRRPRPPRRADRTSTSAPAARSRSLARPTRRGYGCGSPAAPPTG